MGTLTALAPGWWLCFGLAFLLLNTLLTFENRWPGFGVLHMPRLSYELCLAVVALLGWVEWRGALSGRAASVMALGFVGMVAVRGFVARVSDRNRTAIAQRPVPEVPPRE